MSLKAIAPINWIFLFYLSGSLIGLYFLQGLPNLLILISLFVFLVGILSQRHNRPILSIILLVIILFAGMVRASKSLDSSVISGNRTLRGYVSEPPVYLERSQEFPLKTDSGVVVVSTIKYGSVYNYGDILEVSGEFRKFRRTLKVNFPKIQKLEGRRGDPAGRLAYQLRDTLKEVLGKILPDPESSLASGMLLGVGGMSNKLFLDNLRLTGTSHIVTVSGFNISILISWVITIFAFVASGPLIIPFILIVLMFDLMVGFTPPVLRATFMGLTAALAKILGRQTSSTDALLASAAFIALIDPRALSALSFQLSFMATAGIIYLYPYVYKLFKDWPEIISSPLSATLSAQIAVIPLIINNFGLISLISPLANLAVGFTVIPIMILSFLTAFFGLIFFPLGQLFGALALVLLTYFVKIIGILAKVPFAAIQL